MRLAVGCPRCVTPVARTEQAWSCPEHGEVDPLWRPQEAGYVAFGDHLRTAEALYHENAQTIPTHPVDHSRTPDVHAISLVEFETKCANAKLQLPCPVTDLKRYLRTSKSRKFVDVKTVNSVTGRSVKCWVFRNPDHRPPAL